MSQDVTIRFASPADLALLQDAGFVSLDIVRRKLDWHEIVIAERDNGLVGYLQLEYLWSFIPCVGLIHVVPDYRRRGIGRGMLGYVEAFLRERGHDVIYSSAQANEEEPQAWHRHVGFEECGILAGVNKGGVGEIFFRKRLE